MSGYLDQATNLFGQLEGEVRDRLIAVLANPTQETWEDAYSIVLRREGFMTLWQAVLAVDPGFVTSKPSGGLWPRVPDYDTIASAIRYAVTGEVAA